MQMEATLCNCFKDEKFSKIKEIYTHLVVGRLENPNAYGYPEVCFIDLRLRLNYCPNCGANLNMTEIEEAE